MATGNQNLRARLMQTVSDLVYRHYFVILIVCLLVTAFMFFSARRLELKLNFVDMLSETDPAVLHYREAVKQFGALSYLFIVVESDNLDRSKAFSDELARRLPEDQSFVPRVFHKLEIEDYLEYGLFYLEPRELELLRDLTVRNREAIEEAVSDPGLVSVIRGADDFLSGVIEQMMEELSFGDELSITAEEERALGEGFGPLVEGVRAMKDYLRDGPSGQRERLKRELLSRSLRGAGEDELPIDLGEPYLVDREGRRLLMLVSSAQPAEDFRWCSQFMDYVEGRIAELSADYPGVRTRITGNAAIMRDDDRIIRHDMKLTTVVAFTGIMLLFAFSFRNLSSILMVGVPLAVGILWAVGAAYWVVGHLTPVTAIFGAILLGLGIDYAILILSRYTEERHRGKTIKQSLDLAMTQTGASILTGAMATSLAFFSMTRASFRGGQEMGVIAGVGIIIFVLIMTFGLGSLLVAWDRARESIGPTQRQFDPRIMRLFARFVDRGGPVLAVVIALIIFMFAWIVPRYEFEYNYLNLEPKGVESIELVHLIPEWFGIDTNYGMIISRSVEEDRRLAAELRRRKGTVARVDAVSDFIPDNQEQKLDLIRELESALAGIESGDSAPSEEPVAPMAPDEFHALLASLQSLRENIGGRGRLIGVFYLAEMEEAEEGARSLLSELDELIADLAAAGPDDPLTLANLALLDREVRNGVVEGWLAVREMVSVEEITPATLERDHPELIDRFQGRDGSFMIYVYPSMVIWEEHNLKAVVKELKEIDPEAMGVAVLFERILDQLKSDLRGISLLALSVVFVVILLNYRGLWHTLLTLVPLVSGAIAMVAIMNLSGLKFNIINVGMLPLIIGIGVNYGVYVVQRWIDEGKGLDSIRPVIESTGRAVTLSAFTTMIGFSSIILARWQGLKLMGANMTMGIGLCWLAAVVFLPSILKIIELVRDRQGKPRP